MRIEFKLTGTRKTLFSAYEHLLCCVGKRRSKHTKFITDSLFVNDNR